MVQPRFCGLNPVEGRVVHAALCATDVFFPVFNSV